MMILALNFNRRLLIYIYPNDYLKLIKNLKYYMSLRLQFLSEHEKMLMYPAEINFPVARLGDIFICFNHYWNSEQAETKWEERKKRINYNNLIFVFSDHLNCTEKTLEEFDRLPYTNKILYYSKSQLKFECGIKLPNNSIGETPILTHKIQKKNIKKYYEYNINFLKYLNRRREEKYIKED